MKNNVCLLLCTAELFLHQVRSVPWNKLQWANYWFSSGHSDVNCLFKEMMNLVCTDECELQYVHKYGSNMDQIWNALKDISFCIATAETVINAVLQLSSLADALEIKPSTIPAHFWLWIYCYSLLLLFSFLMYLNTSEDFILQSVFTPCATSDADFIYHCSIPDTNLKPATFVLWNVGNPMKQSEMLD